MKNSHRAARNRRWLAWHCPGGCRGRLRDGPAERYVKPGDEAAAEITSLLGPPRRTH